MPFVERRADGWAYYHDVVRGPMLRHKHSNSLRAFTDLHERLAIYYEGLRNNLKLDEEAAWRDEIWQGYTLEALYHRLCQAPQTQLSAAPQRLFACSEDRYLVRAPLGWVSCRCRKGCQ